MTILDEIKARCEAATPGPWVVVDDYHEFSVRQLESAREDTEGIVVSGLFPESEAQFIAHARTDIPRLVKALEKAIAYIERDCGHPPSALGGAFPGCEWCAKVAEIESILKGEK